MKEERNQRITAEDDKRTEEERYSGVMRQPSNKPAGSWSRGIRPASLRPQGLPRRRRRRQSPRRREEPKEKKEEPSKGTEEKEEEKKDEKKPRRS